MLFAQESPQTTFLDPNLMTDCKITYFYLSNLQCRYLCGPKQNFTQVGKLQVLLLTQGKTVSKFKVRPKRNNLVQTIFLRISTVDPYIAIARSKKIQEFILPSYQVLQLQMAILNNISHKCIPTYLLIYLRQCMTPSRNIHSYSITISYHQHPCERI